MNVPIRPARVPLICPTTSAAAQFGSAEAIAADTGSISFAELDVRVRAAARNLVSVGVAKEDRIGVLAHNGLETVVVILALIRLGAVCVPISTRLPLEVLGSTMATVGSRLVLFGPQTVLEPRRIDLDGMAAYPLSEITKDMGARELMAEVDFDPARPCIAVFTSGSSSCPKAAALTYANLYYSALGSSRNLPLVTGDRWLLSLPLYHVGGLGILLRCLLGGATMVIPDRESTLSDSMAGTHVTHISVVPTQMQQMLREGVRLDGLKAILAGGGPVPPDLEEAFVCAGAPLHVSYGLTEMGSQVCATTGGEHVLESGHCGRVLPFRSVRIDESGELLVRGETLFAGYFVDGDLEPAPSVDGWFSTGDTGRFTARRQLIVEGRRDNMFISGGENIQPEEIERALCSFDEIERSVVVDIPDAEFGARPVAFLEFADHELSIDEVRLRLVPLLPRFKHPVAVHVFPDGAEGELSKPSRHLLREIALSRRSHSG
ncbi:MAG: o-succinylbenzoate--CoA ligase [Rhodothermales bacterium]|nr:o-succinylbenzoate--CoA ligase [Rhodothermales bacterium]